jgi:hypothetical protein
MSSEAAEKAEWDLPISFHRSEVTVWGCAICFGLGQNAVVVGVRSRSRENQYHQKIENL